MYLKLAMATSLLVSSSCEPMTYEPIERTNNAPLLVNKELPSFFNELEPYISFEERKQMMIEDLERRQREKEEAERKAREEEYKKLAERQAELKRIREEEERKAREEAERLARIEAERLARIEAEKQRQMESKTVSESSNNTPSVSTSVKTLTVNASAYSYASEDEMAGGTNITATGTNVRFGVVAVDPSVIPLGTKMKIEGFGEQVFVAEDTGGAIKGYKLDIFLPSYEQCRQFGRRNIKIYLLG